HPHEIVGLSDMALKMFEGIDPKRITESLNEYFSPEISWDYRLHEINGLNIGLLHIQESNDKPVVCIKNMANDLKESDIYYKYRGVSRRIKYPELKKIIDSNRHQEQQLWMKYISSISKIGVKNIGLLDLKQGHITGAGTKSFLIDESLLSQLAIIKEGEFSEKKGTPTLKLIGNVEPISSLATSKKVIKTKGIRLQDIILSFLRTDDVPDPKDYITQICHESTAFLPVYYYIYKAKISDAVAIEIIQTVITRSKAKDKLIDRLCNGKLHAPLISTKSDAYKRKKAYLDQILADTLNLDEEISDKDLNYIFSAILSLSTEQIRNQVGLKNTLKTIFDRSYATLSSGTCGGFRKAVCWIDEALYKGSPNA
ncbi:hypothetical protein EB093_06865, partial [bacterium]|nr:hypothetical protein [bacterium]